MRCQVDLTEHQHEQIGIVFIKTVLAHSRYLLDNVVHRFYCGRFIRRVKQYFRLVVCGHVADSFFKFSAQLGWVNEIRGTVGS